MSLALLAAIVLAVLAVGYLAYGRLVARLVGLDDARTTPAVAVNDGVDHVPAKPFYLLGQHVSAIAAAGPIVGPILACQSFGWLPCVLWIGLGVVFIGAVHDFTALIASVRHGARSIAEIVRANLSARAWLALLVFIWIALVYVIVAFTDVTAGTLSAGPEELAGRAVGFSKNGAVAAAATMYLLLAVAMGLVQRFLRPPLWLLTILFVPATLGVVWLGTRVSTLLILPMKTWSVLILAYCGLASLLPVWLLLQPRGYLGGFVLYLALAVGVVGIFFGGFGIEQPRFTAWRGPGAAGAVFPFLFVTIACGACSGFHGLVCSGTTSKQVARESHCRPIGYGGMLLEGFVALIALATILIVPKGDVGGRPAGTIYGDGLARFFTAIAGDDAFVFASTFGAMAFSTFVFDTLDIATRLGRYLLQELFGWKGWGGVATATLLTAGVPLAFVLLAGPGAYRQFWTLFGTSNQLLAALTLLGLTVWLYRARRPFWFTLLPMLFVMAITAWALGLQAAQAWRAARSDGFALNVAAANGVVAVVLLALAALLVAEAVLALLRPRPTAPAP